MKSLFLKNARSFNYLNITQFLGALNDNIFKLLIVYYLIDLQGIDNTNRILATSGAIFVIPFLLFLASSGTLADKKSKRNIIIMSKGMELMVMALGVLAFTYQYQYGAYGILFLMAAQSALFGPSKYGIVPELVETETISQANGLLTSFTYMAVIIGTFLASFLVDITGKNFIFCALFCTFVSFVGLICSLMIEYTPPAGSNKKYTPLFFREIYKTLKRTRYHNTLLAAVIGSAYFLFCGAFIQLNIIPFAIHLLGLSEVQGGYLFLIVALGIGSGAMLVGWFSGNMVELGVVPIAGAFLSICCFLLDYCSESLFLLMPIIFFSGFWGGVYLIPLDSFIQVASPNNQRGQILAAASFLSFIGVLAASAMLFFISDILGLQADKGFTVVGFLSVGVSIALTLYLRDYLVRFIGMLVSKVLFELEIKGNEQVPYNAPALYILHHHSWSDAFMVLGSQRQRIHFFIESKHGVGFWTRLLRGFLTVTPATSLSPADIEQKTVHQIRKALHKGRSVCIFLEADPLDIPPIQELKSGYEKLVRKNRYPIIPIEIRKNLKYVPDDGLGYRLLRKVRIPALLKFISE
jgi:acyl-[acyl-carrier-protein]-phospholipid O-acyltransferase/long-chain-fatty-acid--[acyl-carrier-protein] ligase